MLSEAGPRPEPEYDAFEALCDAVFPNDEDGLMFFWKAHFDASGKHSPLLVVAGYLSERPQWKEFNKAWKKPLTKDGKTDIFHATDFEAGYGDFTFEKGWDDQRRAQARTDLVDAIDNVGIKAAAVCSVDVADYEECTKGWRRDRYGNVYQFAVAQVTRAFGIWSQQTKQLEPISFIVEDGEGGEGNIQDAFLQLSRNKNFRQWFRLGALAFLPKSEAVGLQAADMLANYYWRYLSWKLPEIEPYSRIIESRNRPLLFMHYTKKEFDELHAKQRVGGELQYPEFTVNWKEPEKVQVDVEADFSEAERLLSDLEVLSESFPNEVHTLTKQPSSFEKLFSVETQNDAAANAGVFRISLKPKQLTLDRVSALRAADRNEDLGKIRVTSHEE